MSFPQKKKQGGGADFLLQGAGAVGGALAGWGAVSAAVARWAGRGGAGTALALARVPLATAGALAAAAAASEVATPATSAGARCGRLLAYVHDGVMADLFGRQNGELSRWVVDGVVLPTASWGGGAWDSAAGRVPPARAMQLEASRAAMRELLGTSAELGGQEHTPATRAIHERDADVARSAAAYAAANAAVEASRLRGGGALEVALSARDAVVVDFAERQDADLVALVRADVKTKAQALQGATKAAAALERAEARAADDAPARAALRRQRLDAVREAAALRRQARRYGVELDEHVRSRWGRLVGLVLGEPKVWKEK